MEELSKWLETNKLVKLVKEGKEDEVERLIAEQRLKLTKVDGDQEEIFEQNGSTKAVSSGSGTTG